MVRDRWRFFGTVAAVLGLAGASAGVLSLVAHRSRPAVQPAPPKATLVTCSPLESWAPAAVPVRASAFRYSALENSVARALAELQSGQVDRSLLSHLDTVARWEGHPVALAALGRYYMALRDRPRLRRVLASLAAAEPRFPPLRLLRAEELLLDGDRAGARWELESLVDAGFPVQGRARLLLASLALEAGRTSESLELIRGVREEDLDLADSREALKRLRKRLLSPGD